MSKTNGILLMNHGDYYSYIGYNKNYKIGELIEAYMSIDMSLIRDIIINCRYYHEVYDERLVPFAFYEIRKAIGEKYGVIADLIGKEMEDHALHYDENEAFYKFHNEPHLLSLVFKDTNYSNPGRESMAQCLLTGLYIVWVIHYYTTTFIIPNHQQKGNIIDFDSHDISCKIVYENNELKEIIELPDIKSLLCFEYSSRQEQLA